MTQAQTLLSCSTLNSYLKTLQSETLSELYNHPATCLAVFRELPDLAKQFVMRLFYVEQAVPQAVVLSWVNQASYKEKAKESSTALTELGIWKDTAMPGGMKAWILDKTFRTNLKVVLVGGGEPWTMAPLNEPDPNKRDISYLDQYAQERWDTVLHYLVGSSQQSGVSLDAVKILLHSGLMTTDSSDSSTHHITKAGFQFLLMETSSQVWYFMLQYLDTVAMRSMSLVECLNFLFQLSFATLGKDYNTAGLNNNMLSFLQHLREFGLVYQRKRTAGRFYPTRLALNIASGEKKGILERHRDGYIVIETNYRIYAYTSSDLQVSLIGLFAEPLYRFPNLSVNIVTRDSCRQAFKGGISAAQIIRFLNMHAHPRQVEEKMKSKMPSIPATVVDQIMLWETERNRFTFTEGVLYNQFLSVADFEVVKRYAEDLGVVIWASSANRTIVVTKQGHDPVKKFWKQQNKK